MCKAAEAQMICSLSNCLDQLSSWQIAETVGTYAVAYCLLILVVGDELVWVRDVDTKKARPSDRA